MYIDYRLLKKLVKKAEEELLPPLIPAEGEGEGLGPGQHLLNPEIPFNSSPPSSPAGLAPRISIAQSLPTPNGSYNSNSRFRIQREMEEDGLTEVEDPTSLDELDPNPKRRLKRPTTASSVGSMFRNFRRPSMAIIIDPELVDKKWLFSPDLSFGELMRSLEMEGRNECKKFFNKLDDEFYRVSEFYDSREQEAIVKFQVLTSQWKELADHKREFQAYKAHGLAAPKLLRPIVTPFAAGLTKRISREVPAPGSPKQSSFMHGRPEEYSSAKSKLKLATFEYYRYLGMLKSYKVLNHTGFVKILKKMEKGTKIPCSKSYGIKLEAANFVKADKLDQLIRDTEDGFAKVFEHGDRKAALERLRVLGDKKTHHFNSWRCGVMLGLSVVLISEGIVKALSPETHVTIPYWTALLQLFGAMFLPVIFSMLFYLNMLAWHRARINYVLIFELDIRTMMDYRQFLEIPSILLAVFSIFFFFAWSNFWPNYVSPSSYPLALLVVYLMILLNPFPVLHSSARYWMVRSFSRVITAGLLRVEFRDFFLGDELNSLYYTMYNFSFIVCTYRLGWPSDVQEQCSTNSTWASAGLASLPAFWRLGQSIRRYIDSDGLGIHALNGGKYSASILYNVTYFHWRIYSGSAYDKRFALWVVFAIINSCYTSAWDILMDWSLLRRNSNPKHWLLREELGFKDHVAFYYWAMISNILLRFSWIIYLPSSPALAVQLRGFMTASLEVLRRFQWNMLRVESEHVGNVDGFRVTRDVALPYTNIFEPTEDLSSIDDDIRKTASQKIFTFCHHFHRSMLDTLAPFKVVPNFGTQIGEKKITRKKSFIADRDDSSADESVDDDQGDETADETANETGNDTGNEALNESLRIQRTAREGKSRELRSREV